MLEINAKRREAIFKVCVKQRERESPGQLINKEQHFAIILTFKQLRFVTIIV